MHTASLPLLPLRFRARFEDRAPDARHAAEMWRGAIKKALETEDPTALHELSAPEHHAREKGDATVPTNSATPGYALRVEQPGLDADAERAEQSVAITFFGRAALHALPVMYALLRIAEKGVGGASLRFRLDELQCHASTGWHPLRLPLQREAMLRHQWSFDADQAATASNWAAPAIVGLHFENRLVQFDKAEPLLHAPALRLIVEGLIDRANRLGRIWGAGEVVVAPVRSRLLDAADSARLLGDSRSAALQQRMMSSTRQRSRVPSAGPVGLFAYHLPGASCESLLPLLRFGRWLHVGQQTTAGLGHYRLLVEQR